jgi:N-lysine methyltransferase SETD6
MLYEHARGPASNWQAYFAVLLSKFDLLIWWNETELRELQASGVVKRIGKDDADREFKKRLLPVVAKHKEMFGVDGLEGEELEKEVLRKAHVMASMITAYAFDVEPEGRDGDEERYLTDEEDKNLPKAMVPLADMLNADADRNNVGFLLKLRAAVLRQGERLDYSTRTTSWR